jgi:hypothetical protein
MKELYIVKKNEYGNGLFADTDIPAGAVVVNLLKNCTWIDQPSRTSIQLGEKHMDHPIGGYVNHHCKPTTRLVLSLRSLNGDYHMVPPFVGVKGTLTSIIYSEAHPVLYAIDDIKEGQEITINYSETEDRLANPFDCHCHGKRIKGKKEIEVYEMEDEYSRSYE